MFGLSRAPRRVTRRAASRAPLAIAVRAACESLESRRLLAAYNLEIVARSGDLDSRGEVISQLDSPSINESGRVAYAGRVPNGSGVFTSGFGDAGPSDRLSFGPSPTRVFGTPQINDAGQVVAANRSFSNAAGVIDGINVFNANVPGASTLVVSETTAQPTPPGNVGRYIGLESPSIDNAGNVAYLGETQRSAGGGGAISQSVYAFPAGAARGGEEFVRSYDDDPGAIRAAGAAATLGGSVLYYDGLALGNGKYVLRDALQTRTLLSTGATFDALGPRPGFSDQGTYVAFWGSLTEAGAAANGTTPGEGIFVYDVINQALTRLAGLSANGQLDPGERGDTNGNGVLDPAETTDVNFNGVLDDAELDNGRFSDFEPEADLGVGVNADQVSVAFLATSAFNDLTDADEINVDAKGVWTAVIDAPPVEGLQGNLFPIGQRLVVDANDPSLGFADGFNVSFSLNDPINDSLDVTFAATDGTDTLIGRAKVGPTTVVLSIGADARDPFDGSGGDVRGDKDVGLFTDAWAKIPGTHVELPVIRRAFDIGSFGVILDAIQTIYLAPGDRLVFHSSGHGGYNPSAPDGTGPEPSAFPPDPRRDGNPPPTIETKGNEWLFYDRGNLPSDGSDNDFTFDDGLITDDTLAEVFAGPRFSDVDKLFVLDACFAGGFWQNDPSATDRDLASLPRTALFAGASEEDYALDRHPRICCGSCGDRPDLYGSRPADQRLHRPSVNVAGGRRPTSL